MALQTGRQSVVWQIETGAARRVIHATLMTLFAVSVAALYGTMNFQGLKDARAMELAQAGRVWAETGVFGTKCLRPATLAAEKEPAAVPVAAEGAGEAADGTAAAELVVHRDLLHAPLWPAVLAGWFKVFGAPAATSQNETWTYKADWIPVALNYAFMALAAMAAGALARRLFDERVGLLTSVSFLLSPCVWSRATVGAEWGLATWLGVASLWAAVRGAEPLADEREEWSRWAWAVAAGALTGAAFLSRYAMGFAGVAVFFALGTARAPRSWGRAVVAVAAAVAVAVPWLWRNAAACGKPLGLVGLEALEGTILYRDGALMRQMTPDLAGLASLFTAVQIKMIGNLRAFAEGVGGWGGCGALLALFGAMSWHRLNRPTSKKLRWCLIPAVAALAVGASAWSAESLDALLALWPVAAAYGWAFLLLLLDRLQLESRIPGALAVAAVMALTALPTVLRVIPPRSGLTYPPYFHRYAGWAGSLVGQDEWIMTDMPWATAWYADKTSVLVPDSMDGFYALHEKTHKISLAYFTLLTFNRPWMRDLAAPGAPEGEWYQILRDGRVPGDFPLPFGHFIVGGDQFLMSDRARW